MQGKREEGEAAEYKLDVAELKLLFPAFDQ